MWNKSGKLRMMAKQRILIFYEKYGEYRRQFCRFCTDDRWGWIKERWTGEVGREDRWEKRPTGRKVERRERERVRGIYDKRNQRKAQNLIWCHLTDESSHVMSCWFNPSIILIHFPFVYLFLCTILFCNASKRLNMEIKLFWTNISCLDEGYYDMDTS